MALGAALAVGGWLGDPSPAHACGGFVFAERAGSMAGQQIFVGFGEGQTQLVLSASYAGASGEMAFLLPLASPPRSVADGDELLFLALNAGTEPRFEIDSEDPCAAPPDTSAGSGMTGVTGGGGVDVYDMGSTETYDYVVVGGDTGQSITMWLEQEGFAIAPELQNSLDPYLAQNWVFLAARLRADQAEGALAPLALELPAMPPATFRIPFAFGAASVPEGEALDLTIYVVGPDGVEPANYPVASISLDDVELVASANYERTNYRELFDAAVMSEPEGALVVEFSDADWSPGRLDGWLAQLCNEWWWGTSGGPDPCSDGPSQWLGGASITGRMTRLRTRLSSSQLQDMTFQAAPAQDDVLLRDTIAREANCGDEEGCGCTTTPRPLAPVIVGLLFTPFVLRRRRARTPGGRERA
jgi:hypothetical protein